jgi:hypothetical protein
MPAGDIYTLTVIGEHHNQTVMNVFHYRVQTGTIEDDSAQIITAWRNNTETTWLNCFSEEYFISGYFCQRSWPKPVLQGFTLSTAFLPGTEPGNSLPTSVAVVLTKRTALGGRSGRGRTYLGGVPTAFEADSQLTGAAIQTYNLLCAKLDDTLNTVNGTTLHPIITDKLFATAKPITSYVTRSILRNQRRRQVGRGI